MDEIERQARSDGMRTMYEDGLAKSLAGLTTVEEVLRVVQEG
jgi:general secretion pathway protein E